jgi:uncharacterized protein
MQHTITTKKSSLILEILKIILCLAGIQLVRMVLYRLIGRMGSAAGWFLPAGDITNGLSILMSGLILLFLFRPSREIIGLTPFGPHSKARIVETIALILLAALAAINLILNPVQTIPTIISCLVFPLFEEPIFRGWAWNKLSPTLPSRGNGLLTAILTTLLFSLWHLGYWDVVSLHVPAGADMLHIMLMKMVITSIIGVLAGIMRWKTGNIYASILIHAAWNLFGR